MNREQALAFANAIVNEWLEPPKNGRGYPADGWKPPTLAERTEAVTKLAGFLQEPAAPPRLVGPDPIKVNVF
jgi:hypothetical protein